MYCGCGIPGVTALLVHLRPPSVVPSAWSLGWWIGWFCSGQVYAMARRQRLDEMVQGAGNLELRVSADAPAVDADGRSVENEFDIRWFGCTNGFCRCLPETSERDERNSERAPRRPLQRFF
jgi:hypothetical protein